MPRISSLFQEQRRQAALRRSRSQYAQNESQMRTRNAQHIALARTSNLEVAEEARSRNSAACSQRRRNERIRASERLRNTDNRATWRAIEENRGLERLRGAGAKRITRNTLSLGHRSKGPAQCIIGTQDFSKDFGNNKFRKCLTSDFSHTGRVHKIDRRNLPDASQ